MSAVPTAALYAFAGFGALSLVGAVAAWWDDGLRPWLRDLAAAGRYYRSIRRHGHGPHVVAAVEVDAVIRDGIRSMRRHRPANH